MGLYPWLMTASKHTHIWDFVKKWYPDYEHSVDIERCAELKDIIYGDDEYPISASYLARMEEFTREYYSLCTRIYEESILAYHDCINKRDNHE